MFSSQSRRAFAALAAAGPLIARDHFSPNDRINIGLVGAGGRGRYHLADLAKLKAENLAVVAVCDVHQPTLEAAASAAAKTYGGDIRKTADYREMLTWDEVDAVILAAPDFTHSDMLADAVRANKDVYCEKPMGTVFAEAKRAYVAVKASSRVVQIGTQRRSDPGLMGVAKMMQEGVLGKVTRVDMEVNFQEPRWRRDYSGIKEADVDWRRFTMGRSYRGFDARRFREWQLFRDYTNGLPGLWMSHFIDLVPWFLGVPYPKSAVASGGIFMWKDGRETEDVFSALLEYPNDCLVRWAMSLTNAGPNRNDWYGTRGTLDAEKLTLSGTGSRQKDRVAQATPIDKIPVESHMSNFLRSVRARKTPRADIEAGFSHAVAGCMSAEALRTGRRVAFDSSMLEMT